MRDATILIVDDDPDILLVLKKILEDGQYSVLEAENGISALNVIQNTQPDLIISDVIMPKMNGFEFVVKLKKIGAFRNIPIILLTQKDAFDDIHRGYELGVINYLPKPFDRKILLHAVKTALQASEQI